MVALVGDVDAGDAAASLTNLKTNTELIKSIFVYYKGRSTLNISL